MKKILFCGGGSAGHVIPNIALIKQLEEYEAVYAGTGAIEENICKTNGINFYKFEAEIGRASCRERVLDRV